MSYAPPSLASSHYLFRSACYQHYVNIKCRVHLGKGRTCWARRRRARGISATVAVAIK
jgi:hypothetical protein